MPYWRIFYHLVWAFKNREGLLTSEIEARLYPYWQEKAAASNCSILAVNGSMDHVHLIISIPPSLSVSSVTQKLKGASSHDFKLQWQSSYGVFSISERNLSAAIAYVENQKNHHKEGTTNQWLEITDEDQLNHRIKEDHGEYLINDLPI